MEAVGEPLDGEEGVLGSLRGVDLGVEVEQQRFDSGQVLGRVVADGQGLGLGGHVAAPVPHEAAVTVS